MNTKTMRLPPRRALTPSSNKRKEREGPIDGPKPKPIPATTTTKLLKPDKPIPRLGSEPVIATTSTSTTTTTSSSGRDSEPMVLSNQLLAGYLAHEFLTKGTLLGQPWAPPRAEAPRVNPTGEEGEATTTETATTTCRRNEEERERYAEVACLLKSGGTHLPGVVNPTQLTRFLRS